MEFWQRRVKKTIFTLATDDWMEANKELVGITHPLIKAWAHKIGADFYIIRERKFPEWPPTYEKLQIFELAQQMQNDWNIYIDSDALIKPDLYDLTSILPRDTICHHGHDFASIRWRFDRFFLRDGRHWGTGNWFSIASDLCIELWKPVADLTLSQCIANIFPTSEELQSGVISPEHLIDDYVLSRNIAKYGLKAIDVRGMLPRFGPQFEGGGDYFFHQYIVNGEAKLKQVKEVLLRWGYK